MVNSLIKNDASNNLDNFVYPTDHYDPDNDDDMRKAIELSK